MENGQVGLHKTVIALLVLALALGVVAFAGYMGVAAAYSRATVARVERDVTYCVVGNLPLKMGIYHPRSTNRVVPALLYVHGGGWTKGDKAAGAGTREIGGMVRRSYLVAAVNYRLAPEHKFPAQIEDVKCAVRFLRANARAYGLDPKRIGAWGGSAGGHLVSLLGLTDRSAGLEGPGGYVDKSSRVQAVVDMFGLIDLTQVFNGANPRILQEVFNVTGPDSEILKWASPVTYASSDDPPFLILHGAKDVLVPVSQSLELCDRLRAVGVSVNLVIVKNAGHSFAPVGGKIRPTRAEVTKMVADFFDEHLKQLYETQADVLGQSRLFGSASNTVIEPKTMDLGWCRWLGLEGAFASGSEPLTHRFLRSEYSG